MDILQVLTNVNSAVNNFVSGWPGLILLVFTGILMTCLSGCFQISHFGYWIKNTIGAIFRKDISGHTRDRGAISQFQALCTALAATVGTGNIAGVAGAIIVGGPGAIFWMWIIAFFSMMTNYSENVLGIFYRRRNDKGEWSGGAMYYLRDGLGAKKGCKKLGLVLAALFSVFCFLASFGIGNMTQVNTIASNMYTVFSIPTWITGIVIAAATALVVLGGLKRIAAVTEKIVPFMVVLYMAGTIIICLRHAHMFGAVFTSIFKSAFSLRAAAGGGIGYGIKLAVLTGMKRGVFSNEAGLGSSVMVHSNSNVKEPVAQGMWGVFEVFADTIIVCTLTAFSVLSSGLVDLNTGLMLTDTPKGALVSQVFANTFGTLGSVFVAIAILLFAFSTVLGWSHYGSKACEYLLGTKATVVYRIIFVVAVFFGAIMSDNLAWKIADTLNGLMAMPNLIGVISLSPIVMKITRNYTARYMNSSTEKPLLSAFADVQAAQEAAQEN